MKLIGGIRTDSLPIDNAPNSWIDARNGILSKKYGGFANEDGFKRLYTTSYNTRTDLVPIGAIEVSNGYTVVFSIKYSGAVVLGSEIGYIDNTDAETYTIAIDESKDVNNDLNFTWNHQITGEAKLNSKGEIVVAFTDDFNKPKVANLTTLQTNTNFSIEDVLMFPEFTGLKIDTSVVDGGGSLSSAAYFITAKYMSDDLSTTNNTNFVNPVYIFHDSLSNTYNSITGNKAGIATSKAIKLNFSNLDINYNWLVISCIKVEDGISTAHVINTVPFNATTLEYVFTGQETLEDITLLEIQAKQDWVVKTQSITQIDRQLFLGNLDYNTDIKYQKYANNIVIKWSSSLLNAVTTADSSKTHDYNSDNRTFMHDEVKAFYIVFKLMNGSFSKAYHIAGRNLSTIQNPTALNTYSEKAKYSNFTIPQQSTYGLAPDNSLNATEWQYFQTRCTAKTDGTMGYWENSGEVYPNDPEFNGSVDYNGNAIAGGRNLIGTQVKHHRFPDINWLKQYAYSANTNYGKTVFDKLNIQVSNVVIPSELIGIVQSWQIYYADPTPENSLVATNDILHSLAYNTGDAYNINNLKYNTAGNWSMLDVPTSTYLEPPNGNSYNEKYKCHGFDLLNKPSLGTTYIKNHLLLGYGNNSTSLLTDTANPPSPAKTCTGLIDYTNVTLASNPAFVGYDRLIRKVVNGQYIPNNSNININSQEIINSKSESAYYFELDTLTYVYDYLYLYMPYVNTYPSSNVHSYLGTNLKNTGSILYSLMQYKTNLYTNFYTQQSFVSCGSEQQITSAGTKTGNFYSGDAVIADLCYTAYGLYDLANNLPSTNYVDGVKVRHRYIAPCRHNISLRYEDGTAYSNYLPKTQGVEDLRYDTLVYIDPVVAYSQDYSKLNSFNVIEPFNYSLDSVYSRPYRILRGVKTENTQTFESWREFLNNDYYELTSKNGSIKNLQGLSSGELLIQNNSLYKTRSIGRLDTGVVNVILGSGDIFEFPPQEILPDQNGYIGTQHKIACKLTKFGYISIDAELGRIFVVGDKTEELTTAAKGMRNFFRDYSKLNLIDYPLEVDDCPITSAGINIEYDEKFNRLLVSKKQFEISTDALVYYTTDHSIIEGSPTAWEFYPQGTTAHRAIFYKDYNNDGFHYHFTVYTVLGATLTDYVFSYGHEPTDIFPANIFNFWVNTGFTISYSFDYENWVSFHDYTPDYLWRTRNKLLSFNNYKLFSHNNSVVKGIYYNYELVDNEQIATPYPSHIVPIFNDNPMLAKLFYNINWINYLIDVNTNFIDVDNTFDEMLIWDSKQCSGVFTIEKFTALNNIYAENCRKVKETWFLNRFRDYIKNHSNLFITGGNGTSYNEVSSNIDTNQEVQLNKRFVDKWMAVKVIYNNAFITNYQLNWFLTEIDVLTQIITR